MSLTIREELYDLNDFKFWGGAVSRWKEIQELNLEIEVMEILDEQYPEGLTEGELNDAIWYDFDDFIEEMKESENE